MIMNKRAERYIVFIHGASSYKGMYFFDHENNTINQGYVLSLGNEE